MQKLRVLYVSGIRSEYYFMKPVLQAIEASGNMTLQLILVGQHLENEGAITLSDALQNFPVLGAHRTLPTTDALKDRSSGLGTMIKYLRDKIASLQPDIILATGDREEPLASAIVGAYLNIPVIHYCGGGITMGGTADDRVRDAISALSDIHLTLSRHEADRLSGMGYSDIHVVGHAGIDRFLDYEDEPVAESNHCVVIYHPLFTDKGDEMETVLDSVVGLGLDVYVGSPNSDSGNTAIRQVISRYVHQYPYIYDYGTLPDKDFIALLRSSKFLLGNSSAGVLEVPSLGVPVVNILPRQKGRPTCGNTQSVNLDEISKAIAYAMANPRPNIMQSTIYGDFEAVEKIMQVLEAKGSNMRQGNLQ
jgi:UDP-hydrolysing UDP-N-acetyl-D-glucosamine 2-epimerase